MPKQSGLRLILGLGRSGTTWLSSAIGQTETPIRFSMEGLLAFRPKVRLSRFKDRGAAPYVSSIDENHPLAKFYASVAAEDLEVTQACMEGPIVRNDRDPHCTIVKEVHALLATEALVEHIQCPTVIITRDPLRIIDSLFARDGVQSHYLNRETEQFLGGRIVSKKGWRRTIPASRRPANTELLARYFEGREDQVHRVAAFVRAQSDLRTRTVLAKIVTAGLMSDMLQQIAAESSHCRHVTYRQLCQQPLETVWSVADDFNIDCGERVRTFLRESTSRQTRSADKFPVYRDRFQIDGKPFRFLTDLEVKLSRSLLAEIEATPAARAA